MLSHPIPLNIEIRTAPDAEPAMKAERHLELLRQGGADYAKAKAAAKKLAAQGK